MMTQNVQSEYNEAEVYIRNGLKVAVGWYHAASLRRGWWDVDHVRDLEISGNESEYKIAQLHQYATKIALIHSEISEAMEGMRKDKMDEHLPNRKSVEVELADALIRIFDLAGHMGLDLGAAVVEKGRYNGIRADHNKDNRGRPDGKKF
jgi:NTP pyrophosphatase (non-canonical NTP hydrolase)